MLSTPASLLSSLDQPIRLDDIEFQQDDPLESSNLGENSEREDLS